MRTAIFYALVGYLSGSVLYARLFGALFGKRDAYRDSRDQNPGTANAFCYVGFWCGLLTLLGDLLKGIVPVFLYCRAIWPNVPGLFAGGMGRLPLTAWLARVAARGGLLPFSAAGVPEGAGSLGLALVIAAPVIGHIFPIFYRFRGGKGIAVTFGCLIGLLPYAAPLVCFGAAFIILSVILRVTSHYYRTLFAYLGALAAMTLFRVAMPVWLGFLLICAVVWLRLMLSKEEKGRLEVKLLWMR